MFCYFPICFICDLGIHRKSSPKDIHRNADTSHLCAESICWLLRIFSVSTMNMNRKKPFFLRKQEHLLRRNTKPFQVSLRPILLMGTRNGHVIFFPPIYSLGILCAVLFFTCVTNCALLIIHLLFFISIFHLSKVTTEYQLEGVCYFCTIQLCCSS